MALKKPSDIFDKKEENNDILVPKPDNSLREELDKVENLSEQISQLQKELTQKVIRNDLESLVLSQINKMQEDFNILQKEFTQSNERDINEFSEKIYELTEIVNNLVETEIPKYKKKITRNELFVDEKIKQLQQSVDENISEIREEIGSKFDNIAEVVDNNIDYFNQQLQETSSQVKKTVETYTNLSKIVENKISTENEQLEQYSQVIGGIQKGFNELQQSLTEKVSLSQKVIEEKFVEYQEQLERNTEEKLNTYQKEFKGIQIQLENSVHNRLKDYQKELTDVKADVVIFEKHNRDTEKTIQEFSEELSKISNIDNSIQSIEDNVELLQSQYKIVSNETTEAKKELEFIERYIQNHRQDIVELKEEVFSEIDKLAVGNLQENIKRLENKIDYIKETYSKIEPEVVVKEVIQEGLLNEPPSTDNSDSLTPLGQNFVTLDQLQQHYRLFINRIQQQLSTLGGGGETQLKYLDDIVGIATNASAYDGKYLKYNHLLGKFEFSNISGSTTIISEENVIYVAKNGNDSNDGTLSNPKLTIKGALESIVSLGSTDIVVRVAPGTYIENNPIILPDEVSVIGYSLRETTVIPQNDNQDLFYVGNGNYIAEMSFRGSLPGKSVVSFDPEKPRYITQSPYVQNCTNFIPDSIGLKVDGNAAIGPIKSMVLDSYTQYNQGGIGASITNQGYAQLVSLFTICNEVAVYCGSGGACDLTNSNSSFGDFGLVADGVSGKKYSGIVTQASPALSDTFVLDLNVPNVAVSTAVYDNVTGIVTITTLTDHNFNVGMGVSITGLQFTCPSGPGTLTFPSGNKGYTFNVKQILSNNQFSAYVGVSTLAHTYSSGGIVKTEVVRPFDGQAIYFNDLYSIVKTIRITNGGSGYTSTPIVTVDAPSAPWGVRAKAIATINNGSVTQIDMLSNGRGYTSIPNITISPPSSGINTAVGLAVLTPEYYTISKSTKVSNGISTITINENVPFAVGVGTTVNFFKQSRILASGHSFEFIGSGTDIANSIPFNGGTPPNEENETDSRNGGLVVYTSTNQSGNFKIGDGVTINQNTSSITGQAYEKSLVSTMTPYILSLGAL